MQRKRREIFANLIKELSEDAVGQLIVFTLVYLLMVYYIEGTDYPTVKTMCFLANVSYKYAFLRSEIGILQI